MRPAMEQIDLSHLHPVAQPVAAAQPSPAASAPAPSTIPAAPAGAPVSPGATAATEYGLKEIGESLQQAQAKLMVALQQFANRVGDELQEAFDTASNLQVETWVSEELDSIDMKEGKIIGNARRRALTRIGLTGNTIVCVPESNGELDRDLWKVHLDMVQQAQANRAEFIRTLVTAATNLLDTFKGG